MGAETAARGAAIVALVAGKRLLARVHPLVLAESTFLGATIVTLVAGKRRLARVRHLMATEMAVRDAAIVALVARKWFHTSVRQLMGAERATLGEATVALVAGKRRLARVHLLVLAESTALGAAIVALVTDKRLLARVRHLMTTETAVRGAAIVALVAGELSHRGSSYLCALGWRVGFFCRKCGHAALSRGHALALGCEKLNGLLQASKYVFLHKPLYDGVCVVPGCVCATALSGDAAMPEFQAVVDSDSGDACICASDSYCRRRHRRAR
jgi:hypothetical protein